MNRLPDKAIEYYIKAIKVAQDDGNEADVTEIQTKIHATRRENK